MNSRIFILSILVLFVFVSAAQAQRIITQEEAIQLAIQQHPLLKAYNSRVGASHAMEKTAVSLANPSIYTEAPTGNFYTIGISQTLEFPTVYSRQSAALKAQTDVSIKQLELVKRELILEVSKAFAEAQYAVTLAENLRLQDSLYSALQLAAQRKFDAGEIDAMQNSFATLQHGLVHQQWMKAQHDERIALHQLTHSFADSSLVTVALFHEAQIQTFNVEMKPQSAIIDLANSVVLASEKNLSAQKSRAMPGLMFGYLNQGQRGSDSQYNFQAGITIPVWWWQYSAKNKATKAAHEAAKFELQATELEVHTLQVQHLEELQSAQINLNYYIQSALPLAEQLRNQSQRFFEAGESDYMQHLRTLNDVLQVRIQYITAARDYALAIAEIQFIQH
ncbi:MAG: TolC family protein [Flavobacteriales bacterium]